MSRFLWDEFIDDVKSQILSKVEAQSPKVSTLLPSSDPPPSMSIKSKPVRQPELRAWLNKVTPDVQIEILRRVPRETHLSLLSTSKNLSSTITSPAFMVATEKKSEDKKDPGYHLYQLISTKQGDHIFWVCDETNKANALKVIKILRCPVDGNYILIGSCKGLFCFSNIFNATSPEIVLWNPFLEKFTVIPMPCMCGETLERSFALGFGFETSSLDYKSVRIGLLPNFNNVWADIYYLHNGIWKTVAGTLSKPASRIITNPGIYVNGVIHWIIKFSCGETCNPRDQDCRSCYAILSFDLKEEVFKEIEVPNYVGHKFMELTTLTIDGSDKLVAYHYESRVCKVYISTRNGRKTNWINICAVDFGVVYAKILNVNKSGEWILQTIDGTLLRYAIQGNKFAGGLELKQSEMLDHVGKYEESLVFVGQHHELSSTSKTCLDEQAESPKKRLKRSSCLEEQDKSPKRD